MAVPLLFGFFAYTQLAAFLHTHRISIALIVVFETLFIAMYIARRPACETSFRLVDWICAGAGTFAPLLLRPSDVAQDTWVGDALQVAGGLLCIWAIVAINRRIGLVAANRGICTQGPYAFVRHPLYAAHVVGQLGYLLCNVRPWNVAVVGCGFAVQLVRMHAEERLLLNDDEYRDYMSRTRWRVIPFVY